jgi:hypothetical protein
MEWEMTDDAKTYKSEGKGPYKWEWRGPEWQRPLPDNNPKTEFGEAKPKMSDTPTYPITIMGQVFSGGAAKYGRFNWREKTVSSSVYYDAALRHLMAWFNREDLDPESGFSHLGHVMACMAILMDAEREGLLNDNRPANPILHPPSNPRS